MITLEELLEAWCWALIIVSTYKVLEWAL